MGLESPGFIPGGLGYYNRRDASRGHIHCIGRAHLAYGIEGSGPLAALRHRGVDVMISLDVLELLLDRYDIYRSLAHPHGRPS